MTGRARAIVAVGGLVLAMTAGAAIESWRLGVVLESERTAHAEMLRSQAEQRASVIAEQLAARLELEERLATLDTTSIQELSDARAENDRLHRLYSSADDERRRLRIEIRLARADAIVSTTTGAGRLGDATTVELSERAGSAVWDIRAGIIEDQAKLRYLQDAFRLQQRFKPE